ncbi:autotransporter translocation and assembly factor TamB [Deinococcus yavapaiensis KR-236]|uniref:Autotransporter translocation and assembly factor TamB n=2 Tax=Deinococcus TaxID=1298 RepID=A0A318SA33_9DEIO|nr:autotransporter translocation and assembly factor TamB [Deinococcus yavapaiensis KR-236]
MLLLTLSILLILLFFGTPFYGRQLLSRIPGDTKISAAAVSGPLWRPTLRGVRIEGPGLSGRADEVTLGVRSLDLGGQQARITGRVKGADVNVDLKKVLSQPAQGGWRVWPEDLDVQDVRVNVNSGGLALPNARLTVSGRDGTLNVRAVSKNGTANVAARYAVENGDLAATADVRADATLLRQYWNGVRGGEFRGRYTLRGGDVRGDLTLTGGLLIVPEASFVTVRDIRGEVHQRGDQFDTTLAGVGLGGPVTLKGKANLARERWDITAQATPNVSNLARAFGVDGSGVLKLQATAGGWDRSSVEVNASGAKGEIASVPFRDLVAAYRLTADGTSVATGSAETRLLDENQHVAATWKLGESVVATATGHLLRDPLRVTATLKGDQLTAAGEALAGRVRASYDLRTGATSASVDGRPSGVLIRGTANGTPSDLRLRIKQLEYEGLTFSGTGRYGSKGLALNLGNLQATLSPKGIGTWTAKNFEFSGINLNGSGRFDVNAKQLDGRLATNVPLVNGPLAGPVNVDLAQNRASWAFERGNASWRDGSFALALRGLNVAGYETTGDITYRDGGLFGQARASGPDANVTVRGLGTRATLDGSVRGVRVVGETRLSGDFATTLRAVEADVNANVRFQDGVRFDVTSRKETLRGTVRDGQVNAQGTVDLAAFRALTGIRDLTGRAVVTFQQGRGNATLDAAALGATLRASAVGSLNDVRLRIKQLEYEGLTFSGTGRYGSKGLALNLGNLQATLSPKGIGTWTAKNFEVSGVNLNGSGRFDVNAKQLDGRLAANVPLINSPLAGPVNVDLAQNRASWAFQRGNASWRDGTVALALRGLNVAGYETTGEITYRDGDVHGLLRASGPDANVTVRGLGQNAALNGSVRGAQVRGQTSLSRDFATTLALVGSDVRANVRFQNGVRFDVTSRKETLHGTVRDGQVNAQGAVDLTAFRALTGIRDLTGRAVVTFQQGRGNATLDAAALGATLRASAVGSLNDVRLRIKQLEYEGLTFSGTGRYGSKGLALNLGNLQATLSPKGLGTWTAKNFEFSGINLNGSGRFDVNAKQLDGRLAANVPLVNSPLAGLVNVDLAQNRASWTFERGNASWRGDEFGLSVRGLNVAGYDTTGDITYRDGDVHGLLRASGPDANVTVRGLGQNATLNGSVRGVRLVGETRLSGDFATTLRAVEADVNANVRFQDGVRFDVTSRKETLRGTVRDGQVNAQGTVDLAAFRALTGIRDLTGRAVVTFQQGRGNATLDAAALGATLRASAVGSLDNIRLDIKRLAYEGLAFSGTGRYGSQGLALNLGNLQATLSPKGIGTWTAKNFEVSGVNLNGSGRFDVNAKQLDGRLAANVPLVNGPLAGPVNVDLAQNRASWAFQRGNASWRDGTVALALRGLNVAGYETTGDITYRDGGLFGQARASGPDANVTVRGLGTRATLDGSVRGVRVVGETRLSGDFATTLRAVEADVNANVRFQDGVRFDVTSRKETLRGTVRNGQVSARGALDLAAFRALTGIGDLTGRADVSFQQGRGYATLDAAALGARVNGSVEGTLDGFTARLKGEYSNATFDVAGRVYPNVDVSGPLTWQGQTVSASLSGRFDALRWTATGRTGPLDVSGVRVPAQTLRAAGTLTPTLGASGRLGDLTFVYDGRSVRATGTQVFEALGETGRLSIDGTFGANFAGRLSANATLGEFTVAANGPWRALSVSGRGRGFTASGRLDAETLSYEAKVRGRLAPYFVNATLSGRAAAIRAHGELFDAGGGSARFDATSLQSWQARVSDLTVGDRRVNGNLSASEGLVSGELTGAGLRLRADRGRVVLDGSVAGTRIDGTASVRLPNDVKDVSLRVTGAWGTAEAGGGLDTLRGRVRLNRQGAELSGVRAELPEVTLPLTLFPTRLEARVGDLTYIQGAFGGSQALPYVLGADRGTATILGRGTTIAVRLAGPARGDLAVLPSLKGDVSVSLSAARSLLPSEVRTDFTPGEARVQVNGSTATVSLVGTRLLNGPLTARGEVSWEDGVRATGAVRHPDVAVDLSFDGRDLRGENLVANLGVLRRFVDVGALRGAARGRFTLPNLDVNRASADLSVEANRDDARVAGAVTIRSGAVGANVTGEVARRGFAVHGDLLPRANATFEVAGLNGVLTGDVRREARISARGRVEGRDVTLGGTLSTTNVVLTGAVDGASFDVRASNTSGEWRGDGRANVPTLRAFADVEGRASATFSGSLSDVRGTVLGEVSGAALFANVHFDGARLAVTSLRAERADLGFVTASGEVYPSLKLVGSANVTAVLPGRYDVSVGGILSKLDVRASGRTNGASVDGTSVTVPDTALSARLLGQDWRVDASGPSLNAQAHGSVDAGLESASLDGRVDVAWRDGRVTLAGPLGWSAASGWSGAARVSGRAFEADVDVRAVGSGGLTLQGNVAQGRVTATFPRDFPSTPSGRLDLAAFDVGSVWGRAGELSLTGRADVSGTWQRPTAVLSGALTDARGDLSGALSGSFSDGNVTARFDGTALRGSATIRGGQIEASVEARQVRLARLVPAEWNVARLDLDGSATVTAGGGRDVQVVARNLNVNGEQSDVGAFTVRGSATWTPRRVDADLVANVRDTTLTARGSLPQGVRVSAQSFELPSVGRISGTATLTGDLTDPAVSGNVELARTEGTARALVFGRLRSPRAHVTADLRGDVQGRLFADVRSVSFSPVGVDVRLYGTATSGTNRVNLDLAGMWPNLRGELRGRVRTLPDEVVVRGDGTGRYVLSAGSLLQGDVTLAGLVPTFDLNARVTPLALLGASGTGGLTVAGGGSVTAPRLTVAGSFASVERSGVRLDDLAVRGTLDGRGYELTASQGGRDVATLRQATLDVRGLALRAFGADIVASGRASTNGPVDATLSANGPLSGEATVRYDGGRVTARGRVAASGATAAFDATGSEAGGWNGAVRVGGLPEALVTGDVPLTLGGTFAQPTLKGGAVVLGANVALSASIEGATARLTDGPSTRASGTLRITSDALSGDVRLARDGLDVAATVSGSPGDPAATLDASFRGLALRGTVRSAGGSLIVSDGRAEGRVTVTRERVDIDVPGLDLGALDAFEVQGRLSARGSLDFTSVRPTLALDAGLTGVERAGVRIADLAVRAEGPVDSLAVRASQAGQVVATLEGQDVTLTNLAATVAGLDVTASGRATLAATADVTVKTRGAVEAEAAVKYAEGRVSASGRAAVGGANATFDVTGSEANGWNGTARVTGLPEALLTREARLTLGGSFSSPTVRGDAGLLGANALLSASASGVVVRLADGPTTRASGAVQVRADKLDGNIRLARDGFDVAATVGGTLSEPTANVDAAFGGWTARGRVGTAGGELTVSDGRREGRAIVTRERVDLDLPGLDLASLRVPEVRGTVTGQGTYEFASNRGSFAGRVAGALGDLTIPVVDVPLAGDLDVRATFSEGRVTADAKIATSKGTVAARVTNLSPLQGTVTANLRSGDGTLEGSLTLAEAGVSGRVTASGYPLTASGVTARLDASLGVTNDEVALRGTLSSDVGRVTLDGSGNARSLLADFAPALGYRARSEGASYRLDARLEGVSLAELKVAPNLRGRVSGNATFADGGATFVLRSTDLESGGTTLPARVEGTLFDDEWRLRGTLGDSQFVGSLTAGIVTGRFTLSALPVSSLLEAFSGELPGSGEVTGVARVTAPLSDLLSGRVDVAAERIRVSSGGDVLTGSGSLTYANRELPNVNVQLSGAGAWDVQGRFTRAETNLRASFRGTTFTPVLGLVPTLRDAEPSLRGDLEVLVGGSYDAPTAVVTGANLSGSLADVAFTVPSLRASLTTAGDLTATAQVATRGLLAANGTVTASGTFVGGALSGTRVSYDGDLATQQTGRFERVRADIVQAGRGYTLDATVNQGGVARITGDLLPDTRLTVTARGLTPTLGFIYGRESNVDATATITSRGSDFVVDGAVTLNRLLIGRVDAPSGVTPPPGQSSTDARANTFVSPLPQELRTFPVPTEERPQESSPLLSRVVFDGIPVRAPNGVRVDENLARAELATNGLVLSGRANAPRITGEIHAVRGNLFLRENEFLVQNGSAVFDGSSAFPRLQLLARGDVPDGSARVTVNVSITGEFVNDSQGSGLRLDTRFSSPNRRANGAAYGESELYALLAYGTSDIGAVPDAATLLQSGIRTALNVFVLGEVERNLARALGLDVVRLRTNLLSGESDFRAQLTLGTYLSRDFFVQYQVDLTGATSGQGLLDARYTTPDNRFTFSVSTPIVGLDFSTIRPSLSVAYNLSDRESLQFGVRSGPSTTLRFGYSFRF